MTPMMQQYLSVKENYKDCILFFRLGDFYEMFYEDALIASRDMDVVLTSKACGENEKAPMCGVPYHAAENYIARLLEHGHKVAIAEQMEDPNLAKGIVERSVIRVITPGTVTSSNLLNEKDNNFLACIYIKKKDWGLSWCDISTGEFFAQKYKEDTNFEQLLSQLAKISPKEILCNKNILENLQGFEKTCISIPEDNLFEENSCEENLLSHFKTSLKAKGCAKEDEPLIFFSIGALISYLKKTQMQDLSHLQDPVIKNLSDSMSLDKASLRNLEITETLFEHKTFGSLLGVLDLCKTSMGSRKMKQWLREPLSNLEKIRLRQDAVEALTEDVLLRNNLREALFAIYDLERLSSRISLGSANAKDLLALKNSFYRIPDIKAELLDASSKLLQDLNEEILPFTALYEELSLAIKEDAPFIIREGGLIKPGYSSELDELKASSKEAQDWISSLEGSEREKTGIKNLKVGYNKVFGYFIEISKANISLVPDNYIRKQTLVNAERYITSEMKEMESIVLNAQAKINDLEYRLFDNLRKKAMEEAKNILKTSSAIATCDVLASFAEISSRNSYVKPFMDEGDEIIIREGRHPVIETTIKNENYIPNDLYINRRDSSLLLITGPNMSGKSTYMRQLALIVLMAQAGCFVPAKKAQIGLCDKIFTRIGASDNIALGQSTFFVEMSELAYILNTATSKSLVILDEIGRGTSTYDGLSIAWAVVEYLTEQKRRIRTLFATHYHELTTINRKGLVNLNVDVSEDQGNIVFLHKIVKGSASKSYGIHVASLAGVPDSVLNSAKEKLSLLENKAPKVKSLNSQLSIFSMGDSALAEQIRNLDLMDVRPSEALAILEELQKIAKER